jgi:hypothetical protein
VVEAEADRVIEAEVEVVAMVDILQEVVVILAVATLPEVVLDIGEDTEVVHEAMHHTDDFLLAGALRCSLCDYGVCRRALESVR